MAWALPMARARVKARGASCLTPFSGKFAKKHTTKHRGVPKSVSQGTALGTCLDPRTPHEDTLEDKLARWHMNDALGSAFPQLPC